MCYKEDILENIECHSWLDSVENKRVVWFFEGEKLGTLEKTALVNSCLVV